MDALPGHVPGARAGASARRRSWRPTSSTTADTGASRTPTKWDAYAQLVHRPGHRDGRQRQGRSPSAAGRARCTATRLLAGELGTAASASRCLRVSGVGKTFGGRHPLETLRDVSLHVDAGDFVSIVGPSGCGKSTLFNLIAGIEPLSAGEIAVQGEPTRKRRV